MSCGNPSNSMMMHPKQQVAQPSGMPPRSGKPSMGDLDPSAVCDASRPYHEKMCKIYENGVGDMMKIHGLSCSGQLTDAQQKICTPWKFINSPGIENSSCVNFLQSSCSVSYNLIDDALTCVSNAIPDPKKFNPSDAKNVSNEVQKCLTQVYMNAQPHLSSLSNLSATLPTVSQVTAGKPSGVPSKPSGTFLPGVHAPSGSPFIKGVGTPSNLLQH